MSASTFDTLSLSEEFKAAGFSEVKAKKLAEKFGKLADDHLVTKEYLDFKLKELQLRMTIALGGWILAILTFFKAMEHFF